MDAIVDATAPAHLSNGYSIRMARSFRLRSCAGRSQGAKPSSGSSAQRSAEDRRDGVVIAGPAGVGKTRLTAEAAELAAAQGCAVEWVRASRSARTIPLGAFAACCPGPAGAPRAGAAGERSPGAGRARGRPPARPVRGRRAAPRRRVGGARASARGRRRGLRVVSVRRDEPVPDALRASGRTICAAPRARRGCRAARSRPSSTPRSAARSTGAASTRCGS